MLNFLKQKSFLEFLPQRTTLQANNSTDYLQSKWAIGKKYLNGLFSWGIGIYTFQKDFINWDLIYSEFVALCTLSRLCAFATCKQHLKLRESSIQQTFQIELFFKQIVSEKLFVTWKYRKEITAYLSKAVLSWLSTVGSEVNF